jgi:hypothetical protein
MMSGESELRRAKNEVLFRERNKQMKRRVEALLPKQNRDSYKIGFVCECSDVDCHDVLEMSLAEFSRHHRKPSTFVLKAEHQNEDIERVVKATDNFIVVEKFPNPVTGGSFEHA